MAKPSEVLQGALMASGLLQPLSVTGRGGRLEALCRQVPGQEKSWLEAVHRILFKLGEAKTDIIIARRYLLKDGKMVFGWFLQLDLKTAKQVQEAVQAIQEALEATTLVEAPAPTQPLPRPPQKLASEVAKMTTATPRAPEYSPDPVPPTGYQPQVKLGRMGPDGKREVLEMPLPHVYGELNKPKQGSTKGVRTLG
jgi:hypothetical protein